MKLTMFGIWSIGLALIVVAAAAIFMLGVKPVQTQIADHDQWLATAQSQIDLKPQAQQRVDAANRIVQQARLDWSRYAVKYGLPGSVIDFSQPRVSMAVQAWQFPSYMGHRLVGYGNRTGVAMLTVPHIGKLPANPNDIPAVYFNGASSPVLITRLDLGEIQVVGTFPRILQHYRSWNNFPNALVVLDNLRFEGTSPALRATYTATVYVLPQTNVNKKTVPAIPSGAADQAGAGFGGGGGFGGGPGVGGGPNPYAAPRGASPAAGAAASSGGGETGPGETGGSLRGRRGGMENY